MAAKKRHCYDYPRPAVTVDLAALAIRDGSLVVALIRRGSEPFRGQWALPGGFLEMDEAVDLGAVREFVEETGALPTGLIAAIGVFGEPGRDPRGRTISLAHATAFRGTPPQIRGRDDAAEAAWVDALDLIEPLAFDHDAILQSALEWMVLGVDMGPVAFEFLPRKFSDADVKGMYKAIGAPAGLALPWRRRMMDLGVIARTGRSSKTYRQVEGTLD